MRNRIRNIFLLSAIFLALPLSHIFAKADLSLAEADITFSKNEPFDGDLVRIYARVSNTGDTDVSGFVDFLSNGGKISGSQPISLRPNTYDDVFVDWKAKIGTYDIEAKIVGLNPSDDNIDNNKAVIKDIFVDLDTNSNGVGDNKDPDADGDGLPNEQEVMSGTNPLRLDSDGDEVNDKIDVFPLDKTEWRDTNSNGVGDNKDPDADGDGLSNPDEVHKYGTNPLNADSDGDGLQDGQEVSADTSPVRADSDEDGIGDSADKFPLDPSRVSASLLDPLLSASFMDSVKKWIENTGFSGGQMLIGGAVIFSIIIIFFLFRKKKRSKK